MAKSDKAQITYMVGEGEDAVESILRFHTVIAEDHEVSSTITKFPVQSGFSISNHAIKNNNKISISGIVTNHLIVGATEFHEYGSNNSRLMFSTLKELVRRAIPCEVQTNYNKYSPVIFNRLKTKLQAGKTDIMEFTISGEEAQVGTTVNGNVPSLLVFTPLSEEDRKARVDSLIDVGLEVDEHAEISVAPVNFNESFQIEVLGTNGKTLLVTYEIAGYDSTSKKYTYKVHTEDTKVAKIEPSKELNWFNILKEEHLLQKMPNMPNTTSLPSVDLAAGAATTGACLMDGLIGIGLDFVEDTVDTALGNLNKTIYGALYGILGVNGDTGFGQVLLSLGLDCIVAGAIGSVDSDLNSDSFNENSIPSLDEILEGAASTGDSIVTDVIGELAPSTLTKISSPSGDTSFFGDLL